MLAIILAAGKGKRMKSDLPKVLHPIAGKPMVWRLTELLKKLGLKKIVLVVGHGREQVMALYDHDPGIEFAIQHEQRGTAHAVMSAEKHFKDFLGGILVLAGDVPLLTRKSLTTLIEHHRQAGAAATVLTSVPPDATGYGRIIRGPDDSVKKIVEHADCNDEERAVREINTGIFMFDADALRSALHQVDDKNAQGEFYLTDVMKIMIDEGKKTSALKLHDYREALGVNSVKELQELESIFTELNR